MTKASESIDLKSLKVAGEGASKYITYIDEDNGIRVYDGNNETAGNPSNYAQLNSNGMEIVKDNTTVASFGNTVIIGDTQVSSIVLEDDSIAGYGEDEKTFFNFNKSGSSTTVSSKYIFYSGLQKNLTTKRYYYIPDDILSAMHNYYYVEISIVYQGTTYQSIFGSFTKGTGGVEKTGTIHGVTYTVSTSVINTKDRIAVQASASDISARATIKLGYYKTSYSPAYSLGENTSTGLYSVAEGKNVTASGDYSHAEGYSTTASGNYSHAEGYYTEAYSHYSHAEGYRTDAHNNNGMPCHAEGYYTTASGNYSHAEGHFTTASDIASHAEGTHTISSGIYSHAQNSYTVASKTAQTALGTYNVEDTNTSTHPSGISTYGKYSIIVGNGTADDARSNALTVDWNGVVNCKDVVASNLIGEIKQYAGATVPTGWLECDGSEVAVADYPLLYAAIGDLWGTPSDSDHFILPNFKGKVPVGHDTSQTEFDTVGESGGAKTHTLTEAQIPAHTHGARLTNGSIRLFKGNQVTTASGSISFASVTKRQYQTDGTDTNSWQTATFALNHTHASIGGSGAHNNLQPYAVVKYIICAA